MVTAMPKFQLHDTVVLRHSPTFVGLVERTSQVDSEPLEDCLIIAHTDVPAEIVDRFLATGTPPSGYVFVQFASQEKGSSLVAEDDLHLVDRMLELGDVVKAENQVGLGSVINVSTSYVLDPVWKANTSRSGFAAVPTDRTAPQDSACSTECHRLHPHVRHVCPSRLICNVPFEEVKRAQDFMEGDYVTQHDWLGIVDEVKLLTVLQLADGAIVAVQDPEELLIPIPDHKKPILFLPETDDITRPPFVSAVPGYGQVIPPEALESGQYVITNRTNLRNGRYLRGSWNPSVKPEGVVLLVRCCTIGVHWLICNAYTPAPHWHNNMPFKEVVPYENITTFPDPTELRRNRIINLYDPGKHSSTIQDRTRKSVPEAKPVKYDAHLNVSSSFNIGDQVKFRDPAGAAVKYQGHMIHGRRHGAFERIPHSETMGYDLNEFEVIQSQQKVLVRWQDGTIAEHESVSLTKVNLFEADLMPGDLVVARDGMKQRPETTSADEDSPALVDFNEMTYFEKPHDLLPVKVGIIQHVLAADKLVQVRWYSNPRIRITKYGSALSIDSRLGSISDELEDLSLYEVMSFPALVRKTRDIVVISPSRPSQLALDIFMVLDHSDADTINAHITSISQFPDRSPDTLLRWMQEVGKSNQRGQLTTPVDGASYKAHRSLDWAGEICQIRLDGTIVVRTNTPDAAQDVLLEHDQILAFVDAHPIWGFDHAEDPMDIDSLEDMIYSDDDDSEEPIAEVVEYEGGHRLDEDSGDDNWESEDDMDPDEEPHYPILRGPQIAPELILPETELPVALPESSNSMVQTQTTLGSYLPETEPPSFACLESSPPADQFRVDTTTVSSATFLKRIAKDHRILASSLPAREIYVRTYESRLDLLRCLIIGPRDTPYEHAPFLIDLCLGENYPREPPTAHFHSWTSGMGRINPNLYEEGKICLSLLGTWPGKSETEGWSPKATLLQLLVSLQGLVFVREPFYNEAGFEGYETTKEYNNESLMFSEKAYVMARNFVKHALVQSVPALEDVLAWLYLRKNSPLHQMEISSENDAGLLGQVINRGRALIRVSEAARDSKESHSSSNGEDQLFDGSGSSADPTKTFQRLLSRGAIVMLKKSLQTLEDVSKQAEQISSTTRA